MSSFNSNTSIRKACKASIDMRRSFKSLRSTSKPTVVPHHPFNVREDAITLRKALTGLDIDEKTVIQILTRRSDEQRLRISIEYKTLFSKDLVDEIKNATKGKFKDILVALMTPLPLFYAKEIHYAIAGKRPHKGVLLEIVCTLTNHQIQVIKEAYTAKYGRRIEHELRGDPTEYFNKLMNTLLLGSREENFHVHQKKAKEDASSLNKAFTLRQLSRNLTETTFTTMFCSRSVPHLSAIFKEYQILAGQGIEDAIRTQFLGDAEKALLTIVKVTRNKPLFFAERIYKSKRGLAANRQLIRIIITRCEVDLKDIADQFNVEYNQTLQNWIQENCTGHYRNCLLGLLGAPVVW